MTQDEVLVTLRRAPVEPIHDVEVGDATPHGHHLALHPPRSRRLQPRGEGEESGSTGNDSDGVRVLAHRGERTGNRLGREGLHCPE